MWLGIATSKFYSWRDRYGKVNEHNGWIPRDFWLEKWEKEAIVDFHLKNPLEGYRRLTFMMLDAGIVAVSPSSVWRVLGEAGLLALAAGIRDFEIELESPSGTRPSGLFHSDFTVRHGTSQLFASP